MRLSGFPLYACYLHVMHASGLSAQQYFLQACILIMTQMTPICTVVDNLTFWLCNQQHGHALQFIMPSINPTKLQRKKACVQCSACKVHHACHSKINTVIPHIQDHGLLFEYKTTLTCKTVVLSVNKNIKRKLNGWHQTPLVCECHVMHVCPL